MEEKSRGRSHLGYRERSGVWRHSDPDRHALFLGDFIDRGPNNAGVINIVRRMIDAGRADAIMGNHELNAIQFHSHHPDTGEPLRAHSKRNAHHHKTFLDEFPVGSPQARDAISWMLTLPLFIEGPQFRVVHACWDYDHIDYLRGVIAYGRITSDDLVRTVDKKDPLNHAVDTITKGPEVHLPDGFAIPETDGSLRYTARLKWWKGDAQSWPDLTISVTDPSALPPGPAPADLLARVYPQDTKPVFFGHYWLRGGFQIQAPNALCLDYSAGNDGPLISYLWKDGDTCLNAARISGMDLSDQLSAL